MSVTSQQKTTELDEQVQSDLQRYMSQNPEMADELMKIIVQQYNNPKKISEVQNGIRESYEITEQDPSLAESLRAENLQL